MKRKQEKAQEKKRCYICGRILDGRKALPCGKDIYRCKTHRVTTILKGGKYAKEK